MTLPSTRGRFLKTFSARFLVLAWIDIFLKRTWGRLLKHTWFWNLNNSVKFHFIDIKFTEVKRFSSFNQIRRRQNRSPKLCQKSSGQCSDSAFERSKNWPLKVAILISSSAMKFTYWFGYFLNEIQTPQLWKVWCLYACIEAVLRGLPIERGVQLGLGEGPIKSGSNFPTPRRPLVPRHAHWPILTHWALFCGQL